ncbi:MAG: ribonuclease HI family protein [Candidatus Goldbacteria bacterium]|nr:ribonuclease HI family protein [Candidatus Goldiibacteriota bacterium]
MNNTEYTAYIDGASSGNPGISGIGILIYKNSELIYEASKNIGYATNNIAEYTALLELLKVAIEKNIKEIKIFSDSELLCRQISGEYKIKNTKLKEILKKILELKKNINFELVHISNENNKKADKLAKKASKNQSIK